MSFAPSVEISILIHNQWEATERLLKSLAKYTHYPNYKIILIDNASYDLTVNNLSKYENYLEIIYNDHVLSFAACHNKVMSRTLSDYVCLLTNEVDNIISPILSVISLPEEFMTAPGKRVPVSLSITMVC